MTTLRLALVLVFVSLPLLAERLVDLRARSSHHYDARALPERLGEHRLVREQELAGDVAAMLAPASYTMRLYSDDRGSWVWVYFAIYTGSDSTGAHDPAVCYPAQGWDASAPTESELTAQDGARMVVKSMQAALGGREERVLYWFQPAARWPTSTPREQLLRMLDGLAGRAQYGFVRLSTQVDPPGEAARREADARLAALARELGPSVRQAVTEDSLPAPP